MKRILFLIFALLFLTGCAPAAPSADIAATTLPVYDFTVRLCQGTPLTVTRLVTEQISCLHDYSLNVRQVKALEAADTVVISGAGLEEFLEDLLSDRTAIDASRGIELLCPGEGHEHDDHGQQVHGHDDHHHDQDPHIWLSPANARTMTETICTGLSREYPQYRDIFLSNLDGLNRDLTDLENYGNETLKALSCREIITFHDGFGYFADAFGLQILEAVEEESGSEASAKDLIHLIEEVEHHGLPAIFTEKSGSVSAASVIARETGCKSYALDMAMAGDSYFEAMYHNIDTIKEALS